jgi:ATP-dependent Clp protease, protease subunit
MKLNKYLAALALLALSVGSISSRAEETVVLSTSNTLVLNQMVDGDSIGALLVQASELDKKANTGIVQVMKHMIRGGKSQNAPMYLFLNTPGGSVQSGLELMEGLTALHRPVNTITAFAASMGFQIAQGLGTRYILQSGVLMSHYATGQFQGAFGGQEPSQVSSRYRIWAQRIKELDEQTVRRTNGKQTLASYQKAYNTELWLTGSESVAQGYADEVIKVKCDETLSGTYTVSITFMGFPIRYDLSNCPINSSPMNVRLGLFTNQGHMSVEEFRKAKGSFGALCLQEAVIDRTRVCSLDTSLSYERIEQIKHQFVDTFENKRNHVVPMSW